MRQIIRVTALLILLTYPSYAGEIQNGVTNPPPPPVAQSTGTTDGSTPNVSAGTPAPSAAQSGIGLDGDIPHEQLILSLLQSLLALF